MRSQLSQREIAAELHLSFNTIKTHTRNIYRKLGVAERTRGDRPGARAEPHLNARRATAYLKLQRASGGLFAVECRLIGEERRRLLAPIGVAPCQIRLVDISGGVRPGEPEIR